jgi:hypothetical protein
MRKTITILSVMAMLVGMFALPASATPQEDREKACNGISGTYEEGEGGTWQTATCTVVRVETVTTTEQVNNIKAAKPVLRTTSTSVTYLDVYAYTAVRTIGTTATTGDGEEGETELVMCTPGSGYDACPQEGDLG